MTANHVLKSWIGDNPKVQIDFNLLRLFAYLNTTLFDAVSACDILVVLSLRLFWLYASCMFHELRQGSWSDKTHIK